MKQKDLMYYGNVCALYVMMEGMTKYRIAEAVNSCTLVKIDH